MPPDVTQLRAQMARHLDDLYQLQVIEAAEDVVRRRHLQLLASQVAGLCEDLVSAQQRLTAARSGSNLGFILEAEEQMRGILQQTTAMQRRTGEDIRAAKRAHDFYLAQHRRLVRRIDQLRRLGA